MIADGEGADILGPHRQRPHPADGNGERAGDRDGRQFAERGLAGVGHEPHPLVVGGDHRLDVGDWHGLLQLEGEGLAVAAHRTHPHAEAVDGHRRRAEALPLPQDLVGLGHAFPLFLRHAVAQVLVDPGNQRTTKGYAEVGGLRCREPALLGDHRAVDLQDGALGIVEEILYLGVERAILREQLPHVLGAAARGGLIGLGAHPFDEARLVERSHAHQHAAHGAVAADPVPDALLQPSLDHRQVHRVEDDDGVLVHAERGGGIDPVALPACGPQCGEDGRCVVAPLGRNDDVAPLEGVNVKGVLESGLVLGHRRGLPASVRRREKHRLNQPEIPFGLHAVHQH